MAIPPDIAEMLAQTNADQALVDLVDAAYMKGFKHGLERILYENETCEDVDAEVTKILEDRKGKRPCQT